MLFNFFSKPHSYAMYVDGGFSTVSPLPYKGSEYRKVVIIEQGEVYFSRKFNLSFNDSLDEVDYESLVLLELQRSLDYCERQYRILMPTEFMLVGDGVNASLIERLKENFSLNINTKFPWDSALSEQQNLSSDHRFLLSASYL